MRGVFRPVPVALVLVATALVTPQPAQAAPPTATHLVEMEEYQVSRLNRGRELVSENPTGESGPLAFHGCIVNVTPPDAGCTPTLNPQGLRAVARQNSVAMAAADVLSDGVTSAQIGSASPDPTEFNGSPDDGFGVPPYSYCVNVARTSPIPNGVQVRVQASVKTYDAWRTGTSSGSGPDVEFISGSSNRTCMFDEAGVGYTVASAGWVVDDQGDGTYRLYVTLIVMKDNTPNPNHNIYCVPFTADGFVYCPAGPGGPTPTPVITPPPTPTPVITPPPTPTPVPTATPVPTPTPLPTPVPTYCPPQWYSDDTLISIAGFYFTDDGIWQESNGLTQLQRTPRFGSHGQVCIVPDTQMVVISP